MIGKDFDKYEKKQLKKNYDAYSRLGEIRMK